MDATSNIELEILQNTSLNAATLVQSSVFILYEECKDNCSDTNHCVTITVTSSTAGTISGPSEFYVSGTNKETITVTTVWQSFRCSGAYTYSYEDSPAADANHLITTSNTASTANSQYLVKFNAAGAAVSLRTFTVTLKVTNS